MGAIYEAIEWVGEASKKKELKVYSNLCVTVLYK